MSLLARLLEATPPPPDDADLEHLLEAAGAIAAARESLLAGVTARPVISAEEVGQLAELESRQRAWEAVLQAARLHLVGARRGAGQVRAYAATLAAGCR
jgi:hypothetical protein